MESKEAELINACTEGPVTVSTLIRDFKQLGILPGMTLLVHSSLSKLGWICGGGPAVVQALETVLGPEGTLVMPAHSGDLSDPKEWSRPPVPESWWQTIRDEMPAFDTRLTPTRGMGVIADCFRQQEGTLRSYHPQLSFAARGPKAAWITADHALSRGLGEQSPLRKIYDLDGVILLLGVGHGNNTSLHLSESRAEYPNKKYIQQGSPILKNQIREWVVFEELDYDDGDFETLGQDYEKDCQGYKKGKIGYGPATLIKQRELVDYGVQWIEEHRHKIEQSTD
jgi:aminoglycoside 3-N-acetyltransferase